jgi:hypothetical protein
MGDADHGRRAEGAKAEPGVQAGVPTENTAERAAGPARMASRASWAGQITATQKPGKPAAPNKATAVRAKARTIGPAAASWSAGADRDHLEARVGGDLRRAEPVRQELLLAEQLRLVGEVR